MRTDLTHSLAGCGARRTFYAPIAKPRKTITTPTYAGPLRIPDALGLRAPRPRHAHGLARTQLQGRVGGCFAGLCMTSCICRLHPQFQARASNARGAQSPALARRAYEAHGTSNPAQMKCQLRNALSRLNGLLVCCNTMPQLKLSPLPECQIEWQC